MQTVKVMLRFNRKNAFFLDLNSLNTSLWDNEMQRKVGNSFNKYLPIINEYSCFIL